MAAVSPVPFVPFWAHDDDGDPLAGGQLYAFAAGTDTPLETYQDPDGAVLNPHPVVLDDAGYANVYLLSGKAYKLRLEDQWGAQLWEVDQIGPPDPSDTTWGLMVGGCVLGSGGVPQVVPTNQVRLGEYQAFMPNGAYVTQPEVTVTLSGPDGPYWIALHEAAVGTVLSWTRFPGTNLLWATGAAPPTTPNGQLLVVACVTMSAGAVSATTDVAPHRVTMPTTVASSMTSSGTWTVLPPGNIGVASGATWTCNGPLLAPGMPGILPGPGTVKFGPEQPSNPVWFCASGSGMDTDPWVSADGSGGMIQAFHALQLRGSLVATPGYYLFTSSTPAMIDVPVTSGDGELLLDMRGVAIRVATTGTVFKLNQNGIEGTTNTNLNTVWWRGGFLTTQLPEQAQTDAVIQGTGLDLSICRNVVVTEGKFAGLAVAISGNVADTLTVRSNFFRRCKICVHFPLSNVFGGPQDIYIENNTASISNGDGSTALDGASFVQVDGYIAKLTVTRNGYACSTEQARFVKLLTGSPLGENEFITITDNATEQLSTGSKLIEVLRYGTTELKNLVITGNQFGSPLSAGPPHAQGQPLLDLNYIKGVLDISNNDFPNSTVTAVKLDNFRMEDGNTLGAVGRIVNNRCGQLGTAGGKLFTVSNLTGTTTTLTIGRNGHENFYTGDFPPLTYPTTVRFETDVSPVSALTAAGTVTLSPWDNFVKINGVTIINTITPTWIGHEVTLVFLTMDGGANDTGNLQLNASFRARTPNESMLRLRCDGTVWQEVSRVTEQLLAAITLPDTAGQTVSVPGYALLVQLTGGGASATITTIPVNRNGQRLTFVGGTGVQVTFKDNAGGTVTNMHLASDCPLGDNDTLSLIPNNDTWFEVSRSTN